MVIGLTTGHILAVAYFETPRKLVFTLESIWTIDIDIAVVMVAVVVVVVVAMVVVVAIGIWHK